MSEVEAKAVEDASKDRFFAALAELSDRMIAEHGREFAMGALVLAARFIAENKTLKLREGQPS